MKFNDVRTVQFWPPFVPRAHPPYARRAAGKNRIFPNTCGKVPICIPLTLFSRTLFCHGISVIGFYELVQIFKLVAAGCDVGFCV